LYYYFPYTKPFKFFNYNLHFNYIINGKFYKYEKYIITKFSAGATPQPGLKIEIQRQENPRRIPWTFSAFIPNSTTDLWEGVNGYP